MGSSFGSLVPSSSPSSTRRRDLEEEDEDDSDGGRMSSSPSRLASDAGGEDGDTAPSPRRGLVDLPKDCILRIIGRLACPDACRLSLVCKALREAADAEEAWEQRLPVGYRRIIQDGLTDSHALFSLTRKHLYRQLLSGIVLNDGRLAYWVDRNACEGCFMLPARALSIVWIEDLRYWKWEPIANSWFKEGAYLKTVCWFEVRGQFEMLFQPGLYTVSFSVTGALQGWAHAPVRFSLSTSNGDLVMSARFLQGNVAGIAQQMLTPTRVFGVWTEYDAGEFLVENAMHVKLEFSMMEIEGGRWKRGLLLEGVKIRPSHILERHSSEASRIH